MFIHIKHSTGQRTVYQEGRAVTELTLVIAHVQCRNQRCHITHLHLWHSPGVQKKNQKKNIFLK